MNDAEQPAEQPQPPDYSRAAHYTKEALENQKFAELSADIDRDVRTNPQYDAFFAPYQPKVRENFAREYSHHKLLWLRFGDFYERQLTGQLTQFEREAYKRLWDIQQKKLFDLQCLWRAEQAQVPGVQISYDFDDLSQKIENCTVIEPISEQELALYIRFVEQADYEEDLLERWGNRFGWQRYEDVKAAYSDEKESAWMFEEVSEWYLYHNQHTGNERLLQLPDIRGDKEEHYLKAWRANNKAEQEAKQQAAPPAPPADPRPGHLGYEQGMALRDEFARQFESAQVNRQRSAYQAANPPDEFEDEELERVIDFLNSVDEPVSIEAGPDWRRAVCQASYALRKRKLLENLPLAYQAYCQRREWGIAQPPLSDRERHGIGDMIREGILKGRQLLGEPEDFNF